tara:strand:+ start:2046 stop:2309 length:264 start_codon:yes stop_codon:yes gene_type:complete
MDKDYIFTCPHCNQYIIVNGKEFNCKIFRHGVEKDEHKIIGNQIDPHLPKEKCDSLYSSDSIYGCGKPFRIIKIAQDNYELEKCGYI